MSSTDPPLISVVIPCHNYGRFLGAAIESALHQSYPRIEVIVVDDGSTDDSAAVALQYPVTLLTQANRGVCAAVNRGVQSSNGEFVMRLDADDILDREFVSETVCALQQHTDADFAYTSVAYFGAATGGYPTVDFSVEALAERNYVHGSAMMRRTAFDRAGGLDPNLTSARCEDWDLWLSFAEHGSRGILVPKPLLLYRQHGTRSRNTLALSSLHVLRRNLAMTATLQDNHPSIFDVRCLLLRLRRLPYRLVRGEVSARFALLLLAFYGVMLGRSLRRGIRRRFGGHA